MLDTPSWKHSVWSSEWRYLLGGRQWGRPCLGTVWSRGGSSLEAASVAQAPKDKDNQPVEARMSDAQSHPHLLETGSRGAPWALLAGGQLRNASCLQSYLHFWHWFPQVSFWGLGIKIGLRVNTSMSHLHKNIFYWYFSQTMGLKKGFCVGV